MKILTKTLAVLLALFSAFSLSACGLVSDMENISPSEVVVTPGPAGETTLQGKTDGVAKYLQNKAEKAGRVTLEKSSDCPADFTIDAEGNAPLKILQITDTQMIDPTQVRVGYGAVSSWYEDRDYVMYDILRYVVEQTQPDLILLTGDYVYGEYDDNGSCFREQTEFFDELGIYWAPIFGNHDNDADSNYSAYTEKGYEDWYARKQCQYFENARYCLFRTRTEISGYSNYSIAIKQNGEFVRSVFMLDTHGAKQTTQEIKQSQLKWYVQSVNSINTYAGKTLSNFVCMHVPLYAYTLAAAQYGYVVGNVDFEVPENDVGDFGYIREDLGTMDKNMTAFNTFKSNGADAILAGHLHKDNISILYDGVRMVLGTKSSRYDKYEEDILGATLFTVEAGAFTVSPVYYVDGE